MSASPATCHHCSQVLTFDHISMGCTVLTQSRHKHYTVNSLKTPHDTIFVAYFANFAYFIVNPGNSGGFNLFANSCLWQILAITTLQGDDLLLDKTSFNIKQLILCKHITILPAKQDHQRGPLWSCGTAHPIAKTFCHPYNLYLTLNIMARKPYLSRRRVILWI